MKRAEQRRKFRQQEKSQLPLNTKLTLEQIAGMTGQDAAILQTYLVRKEREIRESVVDAVIKEAQEKLERAEDYIAIANILFSLYAIKMTWGFTRANTRFLDNYNAAREYVENVGIAKAYEYAKKDMGIDIEFENLANYDICKELGFDRDQGAI